MKTLTELESTCSRILFLLEHDDLSRSTLATLSGMLAQLRGDLERHLAARRAAGGDSPELRSAEESLRSLNGGVLWLQEHADVTPLMEVSHKLRMATMRAQRVVTFLQHVPRARPTQDQRAALISAG